MRAAADTKKILVVESNAIIRMMINGVLRQAGYRVTVIQELDFRPSSLHGHYGASGAYQLLLVSAGSYEGDAETLIQNYRAANPAQRAMPVILLAHDQGNTEYNRSGAIPSGYDGVICEPINPQELLGLVAQLLTDVESNPAPAPAQVGVWAADHFAGDTAAAVLEPHVISDQSGQEAEPAIAAGQHQCHFDEEAMQDLVNLGGPAFAAEIVDQFVTDGVLLLQSITAAVSRNDTASFAEHAHALRSCAANVGARGIYDLCLKWRKASSSELQQTGAVYRDQLEQEFSAMSQLLRKRYCA